MCVGRIIKETSRVLWEVLMKEGYIKCPNNNNDWKNISLEFEKKWNFPHSVGAIDGKHVVMQAPPRSGSTIKRLIR